MITNCSRRSLLKVASILVPLDVMSPSARLFGLDGANSESTKLPVTDAFPTQPPELVREMVLVSHFDAKRVRELVDARPSLARASWDWGFGDWEEPLGAASHMGNRSIAEYLISKGARPSVFSAAMLGQLEVVKAFVAAQPGIQHIGGPHGITLLAHAKAGGETSRSVFEFLQPLSDNDALLPVPLSDADIQILTGTYVFGPVLGQQIDITADKGKLLWTRRGATGRPLFHTGDHAFYPAGAPSVRIRFTEDKEGVLMEIRDPELVLLARRRRQESK